MGRRRISGRLALLAFLATPISAVKLADFTPVLTNLQPSCQTAYTTTIPGCTVNDFTNSAHTCSQSCLRGLVQINNLVNMDCAGEDVAETSIIGLFLLGEAIQLLCNVAVVTTTTGGGAASVTAVGSSTMLLSSVSTVTSGLLTDTSAISSPKRTSVSVKPTQSSGSKTTSLTSTSNGVIGQTPSAQSTSKSTSSSSSTSLSPAAQESQKSGNVGSGGGSPFDNIDNSGATKSRAYGAMLGSVAVAILLGTMVGMG